MASETPIVLLNPPPIRCFYDECSKIRSFYIQTNDNIYKILNKLNIESSKINDY